MSKYTTAQGYPPSPDELARWDREYQYFQYQPPHPHAPQGTTAAGGWGIPREIMPHGDAVEHVIAMFKRDVAGVPLREKLRPEYKWSIISVCMAHFLWFRTVAGAAWVMKFYGTEEVPPFFAGYAYLYVSNDKANNQNHYLHLEKDGALQLRIFRRTERVLDPPIKEAFSNTVGEMQELMRNARDPNAQEPIAEASGDMYFWVSEQLRDWFLELSPNKHWPSNKPDRISGYGWAKNLKRAEGQLFYEALDKVELYKTRAYRLRDERGKVLWCGGKDIRAVPLQDYFRKNECNRYSEHQLDNIFRCSSCNSMRACTPGSGDHKMCSHCFGSIVQKDDRQALDWCTMKECNKCPEHIANGSDLVNLKNRLNREVNFPVHR